MLGASAFSQSDHQVNPGQESDDTEKRIERVLRFLKTVEEDDERNLASINETSVNSRLMDNQLENRSDYNSVVENSVNSAAEESAMFNEVKSKLMSQELELNDKLKTQALLKQEVKNLRKQLKEQQSSTSQEFKSKLNLQRKEYEQIIKRHLTFIDTLLAEKDTLSKKCSELGDQVKALEKNFREKATRMEEGFKNDMKTQKDLWNAAEKVRRDKWIAEKSKAIKESTVKGLEPEIQKMLAQHKQQLRAMEEKLREDFVKEKEELVNKHESEIDQLKIKIKNEREKATEEERDFIRTRYQKQYEKDIEEFQRTKRQMLMDFEDDKRTLTKNLNNEWEKKEESLKRSVEELKETIAKLRLDHSGDLEEIKRRQLSEVRLMEERWKLEKEEWQTHLRNKFQKEFMEKEKQMRIKLREERNQELDLAVQRLEAENAKSLEEMDKKYREEVAQITDSYESRIKNAGIEFEALEKRYEDLREQLAKLEHEKEEAQRSVSNVEREKEDFKAKILTCEQELYSLRADKHILKQEVRTEFLDELKLKDTAFESLHSRFESLQQQLKKEQLQHQKALEEVTRAKDESIRNVESVVKERLSFKDEIIRKIKKQLEESNLKIIHLEHLMEKQRQELLS